MVQSLILVEKRNSACTITLNRPDRQNALCGELLRELAETLEAASDDRSVRVIVLRGAGNSIFSSGYDLTQVPPTLREMSDRVDTNAAVSPEEDLLNAAAQNIVNCHCPVIAMVYGPVVGAACDLVVACDMRLASNTAQFMIPAARRGAIYLPQGIRRLINLVGLAAATEMLFTGGSVDARRAKEIGLFNQVVKAEDLEKATYSLASQLANNAPLTLSGTKKIISTLLGKQILSAEEQKEIQQVVGQCFASHDFQEGVRAFLEKRQPEFKNR